MPELIEYYETWKRHLLIISIVCFLILTLIFISLESLLKVLITALVSDTIIAWMNGENKQFIKTIVSLLFSYAAPATITCLFYFKALDYIDKKRWKKKYPQYDISGVWSDHTTYAKCLSAFGWKDSNEKTIPSPVVIRQTCHEIQIKPSAGSDFKWESLSANFINNELNILYRVDYNVHLRREGYPEYRCGYERMTIDPTQLDKKGRPTKMVGQFWHCISDDNKPMYLGDVVYSR